MQIPSKRRPLLVVAGAERLEPDPQLSPGSRVEVAIAQERGEGGQFSDIMQDQIAVPRSDVLPVGSDECVTLVFWESKSGCLEGGNEIDFAGAGGDCIPVGEHHAVPVAEQIPSVSVTMNHPSRELKAELTVGIQKLFASPP